MCKLIKIFLLISIAHKCYPCNYTLSSMYHGRYTLENNCFYDGRLNFSAENDVRDAVQIVFNFPVDLLKSDAVKNLENLKILFIQRKHLLYIQPNAFNNLNKLDELRLDSNRLEVINNGVFKNLPVSSLHLHGNKINFIQDGSFALPNLKELSLSRNMLSEWKPSWFSNSKKLQTLMVNNNLIKHLPKNSFKDMPVLRRIYFNGNKICSVHEGAFEDAFHLETIYLQNNKIRYLHPDTFVPLFRPSKKSSKQTTFRLVDLKENHLSYLSKDLIELIQNWNYLGLSKNPWVCSCLFHIEQLAHKYRIGILKDSWVDVHGQYHKESNPNVPLCVVSNSINECREERDDALFYYFYARSKLPFELCDNY